MNDDKIIELYWKRNSEAIVQSNKKYGGYCFKIAKNILSNNQDSEECVNDTWLHAWNIIPPNKPNELKMFFAKLIRRISFNRFKFIGAKKRGGGQIEAVLDELGECVSDNTKDVEDEIITKELGECIRVFVRDLPAREGDIFARRYFFTESIEQIAKRYSITTNNTMVILSRTRQKLKLHLIKEGYLYE